MLENWILPVLYASIGSVGFGLIFGMRSKKLIYTALGGALTWLIYLVCVKLKQPEPLAYAIAAGIGTLFSEVMARLIKIPATALVIPVNIPLVPGGAMYYAFVGLLGGDTSRFLERGGYALSTACAMALGIFTATMLSKLIFKRIKRK